MGGSHTGTLLVCPFSIASIVCRGVRYVSRALSPPGKVVDVAHAARDVVIECADALPLPVVRQQL